MKKSTSENSISYGLDIGGTKMEMAIFNGELALVDRWRVKTPSDDYQQFLQTVTKLVTDADIKCDNKGSLGIGIPGVIDKHGRVKSANVPCLTDRNIDEDLGLLLSRKLTIANDSRLFSLSEANTSAGKQYKRVYGAIIGTGAAGGLCINGELYQGSNNIAGEYGHIGVPAILLQRYNLPIRSCGCGLQGCYESYIAGPGLSWLWQFFLGESATNENVSTYNFVEQLRANSPIAKQTFTCYMDILGAAFSSLVISYDPDVIIVGGGLSQIDEIIDALPSAINKHLFQGLQAPLIQRANFGDSSGVRGAAIVGRHDVINK